MHTLSSRFALTNSRSPNPRLQRTPLRAPLSRKPLGAAAKGLGRDLVADR